MDKNKTGQNGVRVLFRKNEVFIPCDNVIGTVIMDSYKHEDLFYYKMFLFRITYGISGVMLHIKEKLSIKNGVEITELFMANSCEHLNLRVRINEEIIGGYKKAVECLDRVAFFVLTELAKYCSDSSTESCKFICSLSRDIHEMIKNELQREQGEIKKQLEMDKNKTEQKGVEIKKTHFIFKIDNYYVFKEEIQGKDNASAVLVYLHDDAQLNQMAFLEKKPTAVAVMEAFNFVKEQLYRCDKLTQDKLDNIKFSLLCSFGKDENFEFLEIDEKNKLSTYTLRVNLLNKMNNFFEYCIKLKSKNSSFTIKDTSWMYFIQEHPEWYLSEACFLYEKQIMSYFNNMRKSFFPEIQDFSKIEQDDIIRIANFRKERNACLKDFDKNYFWCKNMPRFDSDKSLSSFGGCNVTFHQYVAGREFIHNQLIKSINI